MKAALFTFVLGTVFTIAAGAAERGERVRVNNAIFYPRECKLFVDINYGGCDLSHVKLTDFECSGNGGERVCTTEVVLAESSGGCNMDIRDVVRFDMRGSVPTRGINEGAMLYIRGAGQTFAKVEPTGWVSDHCQD